MSQFSQTWRDYIPAVREGHGWTVVTEPRRAPRSKYGAVPHDVLPDLRVVAAADGEPVSGCIHFASKREAARFVALRLEQEAGTITDLVLQPQFALHVVTPHGVKVCIARYIADFEYVRGGHRCIEDAKGVKTAIYTRSKKHVEAEYGVTVVEV